jgi:hypothetical protein
VVGVTNLIRLAVAPQAEETAQGRH